MVEGLEHVDETVLASWRRLAERVHDELVAAGLPMTLFWGVKDAGAVVEVDPVADDSGGVWVSWQVHPRLSDAAADAVHQGRLDDPAIQRSGAVKQVMQTALLALLGGAGYQVEDPGHEYRPFQLRVVAASAARPTSRP
jgi:hypothetical protein